MVCPRQHIFLRCVCSMHAILRGISAVQCGIVHFCFAPFVFTPLLAPPPDPTWTPLKRTHLDHVSLTQRSLTRIHLGTVIWVFICVKLVLPRAEYLRTSRRGNWLNLLLVFVCPRQQFFHRNYVHCKPMIATHQPHHALLFFILIFVLFVSCPPRYWILTWSKPTCSYNGLRWDRWRSHRDHSINHSLNQRLRLSDLIAVRCI